MGLAASQARFLCITARKANCEYKSTELAQQKLELTNQLSDISNNYAQAMNSTRLVWSNDGVNADYGVSYSLLMTPSAINDFNPYMITTPSGAIVLNTEYAAAAKAAGISKAGGAVGSQVQRDKFISALVSQGIVTEATAQEITYNDFTSEVDENNNITLIDPTGTSNGIQWNPAAGMGQEPIDKAGAGKMTLGDIVLSEAIGQKIVDWAKVLVSDTQITEVEYNTEEKRLSKLKTSLNTGKVSDDVINQLKRDLANYQSENSQNSETAEYKDKVAEFERLIKYAENFANENDAYKDSLVDGKGNLISDATGAAAMKKDVAFALIKQQIEDDYQKFVDTHSGTKVDLSSGYNVTANDLDYADNGNKNYNVVVNGVINHYKDELKNITLGDILTNEVVLIANNSNGMTKTKFQESALKLLDSMSTIFGYSPSQDLTGQGLNVDDASRVALKFAYDMVKNTYLRTTDFQNVGSRTNDHAMTENTAYLNATLYNRLATDGEGKYYAVSLSNMIASFLTYYENALSGAKSSYVVGKSVDTSVYVTQNSGYGYMANTNEDTFNIEEKNADFFDELYNNILEHGWREDAAIDDDEYLESALKDGRYSTCSLNQDGYYYQTRYNETGYMMEVPDTDAIARAEAEFTAKKAEITFKEDSIDIKTKQLDAEITSLATELDTVKNLIAKSIEKTFQMFSS